MNYDVLQIIYWSLLYLYIIHLNVKYKTNFFPFICVILNLSWEFSSLLMCVIYKEINIGILLWSFLDFGILLTVFKYKIKDNTYQKIILLLIFDICFLFSFLFIHYGLKFNFSIYLDLIISIMFIKMFFTKNSKNSICIGNLKLIANLFVMLYYGDTFYTCFIIGIILLLDAIYLFLICYKVKEHDKIVL